MATAEQVLDIERRWLDAGTREVPDGSNRVAGITDQPGRYPAAWCDQFQMECLCEAGVPVGPGERGAAWVSATFQWYRDQGRCFTDARHAQPGDLVAFEWGSTAGGYDHIGMVESVRLDGLVTIEGNVGNRVQRLFRSWTSGMAEFARPHYDEAAAEPPPSVTPPGIPQLVFRIGSSGEFVRKIQQVVGAHIDGSYGPQTAAAVKVWQAKLGLPADGVWGPATQAATDRLFAFLAAQAQAPAPVDTGFLSALSAATKQVLRMGSKGQAVLILQRALINRGIPVGGGADGVFGPGTNHSVVTFQQRNGLVADGIVGPATWAKLLA
jgi:peptidoglycan hydrolase-like protein with peptidoglycan-binding domain